MPTPTPRLVPVTIAILPSSWPISSSPFERRKDYTFNHFEGEVLAEQVSEGLGR
jgi:hypothetical protein